MNKRLVVYIESDIPEESKILSCLDATTGGTDLFLFRETEDLLRAFCIVDLAEAIFVVVLGTDARLDELLTKKELIRGRQVVLVLYCQQKEATAKSHQLHPRVLLVPPGEPHDLAAIVGRMLNRG
jgi:hypothetical protein